MKKNHKLLKKLQRIPTSQLVFYMSTSGPFDENKKEIEEILFGRLTKGYKLYPDMARKFVDREKEVIDFRGHDIESYSFGKDLLYNDLFKIFYENVTLISPVIKIEENFNTLTMSEVAEFYGHFEIFRKRYKKRNKIFTKELKNNDSAQRKLLNNNGISFEKKEQGIDELKETSEMLELKKSKENILIGYNDLLAECMFIKLRNLMDYDIKYVFRTSLTILKELSLLIQKSPNQRQEKDAYNDINFDAYGHDTAFLSQYNVQGYSFSKKQ